MFYALNDERGKKRVNLGETGSAGNGWHNGHKLFSPWRGCQWVNYLFWVEEVMNHLMIVAVWVWGGVTKAKNLIEKMLISSPSVHTYEGWAVGQRLLAKRASEGWPYLLVCIIRGLSHGRYLMRYLIHCRYFRQKITNFEISQKISKKWEISQTIEIFHEISHWMWESPKTSFI